MAMPEATGDFAALLAQARSGDKEALDQLVREYEPKLRLVARVLLGPALRPYLDSVDLVQSVHKSVLLGLRDQKFDVEGPDNLLALALTLVRRKVARHWRRLQRQHGLRGTCSAPADLASVLTDLSRPQDDPAQVAQFHDQVLQLCRNVKDTERRLLELRLEGYNPAECALELGLSA